MDRNAYEVKTTIQSAGNRNSTATRVTHADQIERVKGINTHDAQPGDTVTHRVRAI